MVYEHELRLFFKALQPRDKPALVGMAADAGQSGDLGLDFDVLVEELDPLCAVVQGSAERADRLVAHEQHQRFGPP